MRPRTRAGPGTRRPRGDARGGPAPGPAALRSAADGLLDEVGHRLGPGDVDGVAAGHLDGPGADPPGHGPLRGRGIIRSSAATRCQAGLVRQAGRDTAPLRVSKPQGTWESATNAAWPAGTSAANEAANLSRSRNRKPSRGGRMGGTGAPGGGSAMRVLTDSPLSGANAAR